MLKLQLQYFGHLMWRTDPFEKTLMLGKIEGRRRRGWQRMRWLDGITDSMDMHWVDSGSWWWMGGLVCCSPWGRKESDKTERLNWTDWWTFRLLLCLGYCKQHYNEYWDSCVPLNHIFSKYMPRSAWLYGSSIFSFLRTPYCSPLLAAPIYVPTNSLREFPRATNSWWLLN